MATGILMALFVIKMDTDTRIENHIGKGKHRDYNSHYFVFVFGFINLNSRRTSFLYNVISIQIYNKLKLDIYLKIR